MARATKNSRRGEATQTSKPPAKKKIKIKEDHDREETNKENSSSAKNDATDALSFEDYLMGQLEVFKKRFEDYYTGLAEDMEIAAMREWESVLEPVEESCVAPVQEDRVKILLKCIEGMYAGQEFRLSLEDGKASLIGRSSTKKFTTTNNISLSEDDEVSTQHAKLEVQDGQILFTDLNSTNGSHINSLRMEPNAPATLSQGDILMIGQSKFVFSTEL